MKRKVVVSSLIAAGILAPMAAGGAAFDEPPVKDTLATAHAVLHKRSAAPTVTEALPDPSWLAQQYGPAVVNISASVEMKKGMHGPNAWGFTGDDPFYQFFRRFEIPAPGGEIAREELGSGFIVSADGYILTNSHVVGDAKEVMVTLTDRREFNAKVIGTDPGSDVAVLKIEANNLPTVKLGDPKNMRVGEWVIAMGSPYGFGNSLMAGIVSAKGRVLRDGSYVPYIQTDMAADLGDSGGPLFNTKGEVIGINSQTYAGSGSYYGLSFAIPIDLATKIQDQLVRYGKVTRGRIGVTIQEVDQPLARSFGMDHPKGALVSSVDMDGPAAKAGIEAGDVILKVDGKPIDGATDLTSHVAQLKPGTEAKFEVWRNGSAKRLTITIGEMPASRLASAGDSNLASQPRLGVSVRALTKAEQQDAGVKGGLLVKEVDGSAAEAGVERGDVILALNNTPVKSAEELRAMLGKSEKVVALLVMRQDAKIYIPVKLG